MWCRYGDQECASFLEIRMSSGGETLRKQEVNYLDAWSSYHLLSLERTVENEIYSVGQHPSNCKHKSTSTTQSMISCTPDQRLLCSQFWKDSDFYDCSAQRRN
jgi:hypothetical protein